EPRDPHQPTMARRRFSRYGPFQCDRLPSQGMKVGGNVFFTNWHAIRESLLQTAHPRNIIFDNSNMSTLCLLPGYCRGGDSRRPAVNCGLVLSMGESRRLPKHALAAYSANAP